MIKNYYTALFLCILCFLCSQSMALTVETLQQRVNAKERLTIIDIRLPEKYAAAHIPNAINIPLAAIETKRLPPIGNVVVYDDGISDIEVNQAVALLNQKRGINAEALDGGFLQWETKQSSSYEKNGLLQGRNVYIDYPLLADWVEKGQEFIIVDLMNQEANLPQALRAYHHLDITNLSTSATIIAEINQELANVQTQLLLLVDDNNLLAEKVAKQLYAAEITRVRVLAGGRLALEQEGKSGSKTRVYVGGKQQ